MSDDLPIAAKPPDERMTRVCIDCGKHRYADDFAKPTHKTCALCLMKRDEHTLSINARAAATTLLGTLAERAKRDRDTPHLNEFLMTAADVMGSKKELYQEMFRHVQIVWAEHPGSFQALKAFETMSRLITKSSELTKPMEIDDNMSDDDIERELQGLLARKVKTEFVRTLQSEYGDDVINGTAVPVVQHDPYKHLEKALDSLNGDK